MSGDIASQSCEILHTLHIVRLYGSRGRGGEGEGT